MQSSHSSEHSPQPNISELIDLRDRAAQVALNFAGQTIDSYDGTYSLLIDCIYDALVEIATLDGKVNVNYFVGEIVNSPFSVCSKCPNTPKRAMWLTTDNKCEIHPESELRRASWQERADYLGWVIDRMKNAEVGSKT